MNSEGRCIFRRSLLSCLTRPRRLVTVNPGLLVEGAVYDLPAYSSGGSNYFKLEDILNLLGFATLGDGEGNYIVDTTVIPSPVPNEMPSETPLAPAA